MSDPRGFLKFKRKNPERRPVTERIQDWKEIYLPQKEEELKTQATRCMDCGVPFCQGNTGCPVRNYIPEWNDLSSNGKWEEALQSLHSTNNFPEFTGKLCPAPCESACVLGIGEQPVSIRVTESSIIDRGFDQGWVKPVLPVIKTSKRIAIVGSGPAGSAAAQQFARAGHSVTVFEKNDRIGGLLRYGIPEFKMEKWVLDRRLKQMSDEGVTFKTKINVGVDIELSKLKEEFHAVCLTTGAEEPRDLAIPGRELNGIHFAMEYLVQANKVAAGDTVPNQITAKGKRVIVIGGGDTGSDCVGTAHRQGAKEIHQFEFMDIPPKEISPSTPWPMWPRVFRTSHAHEEGCDRQWSISTTGFRGANGKVTHVDAVYNHDGKKVEYEADLVVLAMGFKKPPDQTPIPGVFVAGDARRGPSLIVWAIAEGRKMAENVEEFLQHR